MKNKAQAEIFGVLFAVIGFFMGYFMTKTMEPGLFWTIITIGCCTVAGYAIPTMVGNKG